MLKLLIAACPGALADLLAYSLSSRFIIHSCGTSSDALRLMETTRPDVLILQMQLDGQNGLSVLHNCRYKPRAILVLTDVVNQRILKYAADAAVDAVITLPCSAKYVEATIDRILEKVPSPEA